MKRVVQFMEGFWEFTRDFWESIGTYLGIAIMAISAVYQFYSDGVISFDVTILLGLVIFVFFGLLERVKSKRKARDTQETLIRDKTNVHSETQRGGTQVRGNNSAPIYNNSPITSIASVPPVGYEIPTTRQILRKIGIEIQELEDQFEIASRKELKDKYGEIVKAREILDKIKTGALRHAKIELKGTLLITLFENLERKLTRYGLQISTALEHEADRRFYATSASERDYLPTVIERINQHREDMFKTETTIVNTIEQIKKFENEYNNWLIS